MSVRRVDVFAAHLFRRHEGRGSAGPACRKCGLRRARQFFDQSEIQYLDEIGALPEAADEHVAALDVAMHQSSVVCLFERFAGLPQEPDDAARRLRPILIHEGFRIQAVQILHRVIERSVLRQAVIVDRHGVRRPQRRDRLRFRLEALLD